MSQNVIKKEYLDTYLKEIPRIFEFASIISSVIFGNDDIVPLDFPYFGVRRDGQRYVGPTSGVTLEKKENLPLTGAEYLPERLKSR